MNIEVPKTGFTDDALERLRKIIASKESLLKKALGAETLPLEVSEKTLCFPWFSLSDADGETDAYTRLVCAICEMAKRQKRVTATEQAVENEKFAMRIFLIRLGFIGPEYEMARAILLRNLTGNGSWKHGKPEKSAGGEAAKEE